VEVEDFDNVSEDSSLYYLFLRYSDFNQGLKIEFDALFILSTREDDSRMLYEENYVSSTWFLMLKKAK
jgi:hypothetical protein